MAVAVSITVLAGSAVGCAADDPGPTPTGTDADQPEAPQEPAPAAAAEPDPDPSADGSAGESEPAAADAPDQGEDNLADEAAEEAAASSATTSQQLSTGPVLEWTEIDPGFDDLFELKSVGDGRVVARAWTDDEGEGTFGQRIVVSADGTDWAEVPMPDGLFPEQVNISADRWVVTGQFLDSGRPEEAVDRVFFSDDQGSTWTEMVLDPLSTSISPYAFERWRASLVLVSGERMVLALSGSTMIDGQALLEDVGRLPTGKRVVFALPTPDGVSFTLVDADAPHPYGSLTSAAWGLAAAYSRLDREAQPVPAYEELELTYDEVDFTEAEMFDLFAPGFGPLTRILAGEGITPEVVTGFEGWVASGAATDEGFILTAVDDGGDRVLSSRDGLLWSEGPALGAGFVGGTIAADGTIWWVTFEAAESFDLQQARPGETPTTVATFDGLPLPLAVGPAGLVMVAERQSSRPLPADQGLPAEGRVSRDGYELRYNETESTLALWDLAEDTVIYEFGPEDMQSDTPPDGVRVIEGGRLTGMAFEDPETGADLVTFTAEDMAFLLGMAAADLEAASGVDPEWPELWLGWSADGTAWGLQRLADAFGIHDAFIWPEFAIGRDVVIVRVASFQPPNLADPTDTGQVLPTRWFLAQVP